MTNERTTAIQFPCEFPIKVMGHACDEFEIAVLHIMHKHFPALRENVIKTRASKKGNFVSLTITVYAESQTQLDSVYQELTDCELVMVAL